MNRRNFLSLIPALSASPFLAKELIQNEDEIRIIKPELVKATPITKINYERLSHAFKTGNVKLTASIDGEIIGEGLLTDMTIGQPEMIDISSSESPQGWREFMPGPVSAEIHGQLYSLFL